MCGDIGDAPFNIISLGNFYQSGNFMHPIWMTQMGQISQIINCSITISLIGKEKYN